MAKQMKAHEPLFHVSKNDAMPTWKALRIRLIAILAALVTVGILSVILIKENPFAIYAAMFKGAFIDVWTLVQNTALLLMFGLAVVPAFKMKYWNMGANGCVLMGCLVAIACMRFMPVWFKGIPEGIIILCMIVTSILAASLWSVIPAFFKATFGTNETLFTLMMNYIAIATVNYFVFVWDKTGSGTLKIDVVNKRAWFPELFGNKYLMTIVVAAVITAFMYVYMKYTKHGFETSLVGESVNTAKYVGINVRKVIIRTLLLSGVICGILGALYAGSVTHTINTSVGGLGFTAILIAWLAGFDSVVMVLTSFFVVFLNTGAKYVSVAFQLNSDDYANIVVGIIFFFIIGCEFFIRYKLQLNGNRKKAGKEE